MRIICLILAFTFSTGAVFAQAPKIDAQEMSRFLFENDWVGWHSKIGDPMEVEKLFIRDKNPLNVHRLREFRNLKGLIIFDSPLTDLRFLDVFPKLRILEVQGNGLKSLEGIEQMPLLEEFGSNSNFVRDLSPLDSLMHLRKLTIYDNEIESLEPISHLKTITHLDISKSNVRSLEPIKDWTQLEVLSVYRCPFLTDISVIENFVNITDLNISFLDSPNFTLKYLEKMTEMQNLRVQGMVKSNQELNYIANHIKMEQLTMGKNDDVTDISALKYMEELEYLDIHSNNVEDITVCSNFPKLVKFVMYRNKVQDINPLLNCVELRSLFLHENPVADYSPLFQMGYLQHLNLSKSDFDKESGTQLRQALRSTKISFM